MPVVTTLEELIEVLVKQHQEVRALLRRLPATRGVERRDAFLTLRNSLAVHESLEHVTVRRDQDDRDEAAARTREEDQVAAAFPRLEALPLESAEFDAALVDLTAAIDAHATAEETTEFPFVRGDLNGEQQAQVREALGLLALPDFTLGNTFGEMLQQARSRMEFAGRPQR